MKLLNKEVRVPKTSWRFALAMTIYIFMLMFVCVFLSAGIYYEAFVFGSVDVMLGMGLGMDLISKGRELKLYGYPQAGKWIAIGVISIILSFLLIPNIITIIWYYQTNVLRKYALAHNEAYRIGLIADELRKNEANRQRMDDEVRESVRRTKKKAAPQGQRVSRTTAKETPRNTTRPVSNDRVKPDAPTKPDTQTKTDIQKGAGAKETNGRFLDI